MRVRLPPRDLHGPTKKGPGAGDARPGAMSIFSPEKEAGLFTSLAPFPLLLDLRFRALHERFEFAQH
jgi:hypothetical protein